MSDPYSREDFHDQDPDDDAGDSPRAREPVRRFRKEEENKIMEEIDKFFRIIDVYINANDLNKSGEILNSQKEEHARYIDNIITSKILSKINELSLADQANVYQQIENIRSTLARKDIKIIYPPSPNDADTVAADDDEDKDDNGEDVKEILNEVVGVTNGNLDKITQIIGLKGEFIKDVNAQFQDKDVTYDDLDKFRDSLTAINALLAKYPTGMNVISHAKYFEKFIISLAAYIQIVNNISDINDYAQKLKQLYEILKDGDKNKLLTPEYFLQLVIAMRGKKKPQELITLLIPTLFSTMHCFERAKASFKDSNQMISWLGYSDAEIQKKLQELIRKQDANARIRASVTGKSSKRKSPIPSPAGNINMVNFGNDILKRRRVEKLQAQISKLPELSKDDYIASIIKKTIDKAKNILGSELDDNEKRSEIYVLLSRRLKKIDAREKAAFKAELNEELNKNGIAVGGQAIAM